MPTGIEETIAVIGGGIAALIGWANSLPMEFKYIIFLGGLAVDSGFTNFIGSGFSYLISFIFNLPGFQVSSFQLLVAFSIMPVAFYLIKHGR